MSKHTRGPWYRNIKPARKYVTIFAGDAPRHVHVAHLATKGLSDEEIEANCDLIVAAPALLAALRGLLELHRPTEAREVTPQWREEQIAAACAAIVKAEG